MKTLLNPRPTALIRRLSLVILVGCLVTTGRPALAQAPAASAAGRWEGAISGTVTELAITVTLTAGPKWSGTIDIPAQGASAMPLGDVIVQGSAVRLRCLVPGDPAFKGTLSPDGTPFPAGSLRPDRASLQAATKGRSISCRRVGARRVRRVRAIGDEELGRARPGVAIVKDGKVVLAKGYGLRNVQANPPVTADTLFAIGSSTKAFTTMAMGILVEEGKLAWDEPVTKYLPKFALKDEVAGKRMTPRDLVTHRSGLPRHDLVWYNAKLSRAELVATIALPRAERKFSREIPVPESDVSDRWPPRCRGRGHVLGGCDPDADSRPDRDEEQ